MEVFNMSYNSERNIDKIIKYLYGVKPNQRKSKNRWIDTKPGWKNYKHNEEKENIIDEITKVKLDTPRNDNNLKELPLHNVLLTAKSKYKDVNKCNNEKNIEKLIATIYEDNEKVSNQWCVGQNQESVDLVICDNNKKYTLIELKSLNNNNASDSPIFALIETIKNYCLLKKYSKEKSHICDIEEFCLLAPKDYYEHFFKGKDAITDINEFYKTVEKFNEENKVLNLKFTMKFINKNGKDIVNNAQDKYHNGEKREDNGRFEINKHDINSDEYLRCLLLENWQNNDISTREKLREKLGI